VRRHAIALVESTNLLLIPGRHIATAGAQALRADEADPGAELAPAEIEKRVLANWPAWTTMAHALHDSAMTVLAAVDKKDAAALETTGSDLDGVCESCHLTFWYPPPQKQAAAPAK
jgi:cytochrome c556